MAKRKRYKFQGIGLTDEEYKWAKKRFKEYQKIYSIEKPSDLHLLEDLIYREVMDRRLKKRIKELDEYNSNVVDKKGKTKKPIIPRSIREALDENLEKQLLIKEKLGFFQDKNQDDFYKYIETQKRKFENYREDHPLEFKITCPFCGEKVFLNRRVKDFKPSQLKLYRNRILLNEEMWKDYKKGKLKKSDYARYINTHENFIDWLEKHIKD